MRPLTGSAAPGPPPGSRGPLADLPGFVAAALELAITLLDRDQDRVADAVDAYLEARG
jgi:hypothetical protein